MIRHIVLFKFKTETTENDKAALLNMLRELPGKIDKIIEMKVGADVVRSPRSFDMGLTSLFASLDDLGVYAVHPDHLPVVSKAKEICEQVVAVDFEE